MKHHLMITLGLVMAVIFVWRGVEAFSQPGLGVREAYVAGGFLIAGLLVVSGLREWRRSRR